jgi:hypothetical protein
MDIITAINKQIILDTEKISSAFKTQQFKKPDLHVFEGSQ